MKDIITDISLLEKPAKPLEFISDIGMEKEEGEGIIKELKEVLEAHKEMKALAAPQIGIDARIFCIKFDDVIKTFINPIITKKEGSSIAPETFVSMPGKEILIARPDELTVVYYTDEFKYEDNKLLGAAARIFDQQYQLLDGVLPSELGLVSDTKEDGSLSELTEEEFKQVLDIYKQFVEAKKKSLEEAIHEDDELAKQYNSLRFTEKVINGDIQVVESEAESKARQNAKNMANNSMLWSNKLNSQAKKAEQRAGLEKMLRKKRGK